MGNPYPKSPDLVPSLARKRWTRTRQSHAGPRDQCAGIQVGSFRPMDPIRGHGPARLVPLLGESGIGGSWWVLLRLPRRGRCAKDPGRAGIEFFCAALENLNRYSREWGKAPSRPSGISGVHGLCGKRSRLGLRHGLGRRWRFRYFDSASDDGSILNEDPRRPHVAIDRAGIA